jgi:peptidoglycan/LPS O-acetylase OafA/YrhL
MKNRIDQLDSIRGLAAFSVFMSHMPIMGVGLPLAFEKLLIATGVINGHGAVMIFFTLSGFVLSIPFLTKNEIDYVPFLIKRIFRIYAPYLIAIIFAIFLSQIFLSNKISGLGDFIGNSWNIGLNSKLILEHIYLIGDIHSDSFNGVIWSLIQELRISLVFPFIVLVVKRSNWKISVLICFILSCIAGLNDVFHFQSSNGYLISYFDTLNFLSIFITGSLLAKHRFEVVRYFQKLKTISKIIICIISVFLFNFSGMLILYLYKITGFKVLSAFFLIIEEYGMTLGAICFFIMAMGSSKVKKILLKKPIKFMGTISYSLYLYHPLILLSCIHLFYNILPLWIICITVVILSILVSYIAWKFVEVPSMRLGRFIAETKRKIQNNESKSSEWLTKNG